MYEQSASYQRFVAESAKHCDCDPPYCPCDGVLSGGMCDGFTGEPEYPEDAGCGYCGDLECHGDCDEAEGWE